MFKFGSLEHQQGNRFYSITPVDSQNASEVKSARLYTFWGTEHEYDNVVNWLYFRRSGVGPNLCIFVVFGF